MDRLEAADARCAGVLDELAHDDIADSVVYRGLRSIGSVGHGVGYLAMVPARVAPELAVVGVVGDALGTAADGALLLGYDEGSWRDLAVGAGTTALGAGGRTLRNGAKAGTVVRADGTVVAQAMTAPERVLAGAVTTARKRVEAARARLRLPPERGTPSALTGGPPPAPSGTPWRRAAGSARAAVRAQVVSATTELRLVGAGGRQTRRMYAAGVGLEATSRAAPRLVPESARPTRAGRRSPSRPSDRPGPGAGPGTW